MIGRGRFCRARPRCGAPRRLADHIEPPTLARPRSAGRAWSGC
jgi:hypothetical protein